MTKKIGWWKWFWYGLIGKRTEIEVIEPKPEPTVKTAGEISALLDRQAAERRAAYAKDFVEKLEEQDRRRKLKRLAEEQKPRRRNDDNGSEIVGHLMMGSMAVDMASRHESSDNGFHGFGGGASGGGGATGSWGDSGGSSDSGSFGDTSSGGSSTSGPD